MSQYNLNLYQNLYLIRRTQEEISKNYHPEDKMRCPIHLCFGQEFMPSVLGLFLKKNDAIYSHHRSHGYFLAKGGSVKEMICEFYGKANGTNGGLAGSQELSCSKINFNSGTILSGAFAMAVGDAYAKKINKTNSITVTVIGDGGMEEGIVYESLNLAALKKVPVLFICENNLYSTHTRVTERVVKNNITSKVKQFGLRTLKLNSGNYEDYISRIKKEKGETNITGAFLSTYLQEWELRLVENTLSFICNKTDICKVDLIGFYDAIYEFDGLKLNKNKIEKYGGVSKVLELMNNLNEEMGFNVKWEIMSDCLVVEPPTRVECAGGVCIAFYN